MEENAQKVKEMASETDLMSEKNLKDPNTRSIGIKRSLRSNATKISDDTNKRMDVRLASDEKSFGIVENSATGEDTEGLEGEDFDKDGHINQQNNNLDPNEDVGVYEQQTDYNSQNPNMNVYAQQQYEQQELHNIKYSGYSDMNKPENWRTAIDHETGRQYHYNVQTRVAQWNSPNEIPQQIPTTGDYLYQTHIPGRRRRRSMKEMQDAWDRGDKVGLWECPDCSKILTEGSKKTHPDSCNARKARSVHMVQGTPSDILAGAHWRAASDRNGKTYFYHQITKKTSWTQPKEMQNFDQYQRNQALMQNSLSIGSNNYNQWTKVTDPCGQIYYYNNLTGVSTFNKPSDYRDEMQPLTGSYSAPIMQSSIEESNKNDEGEWIEVIDSSSGNKYYYNSVTKSSSWTNPALESGAKEEQPELKEVDYRNSLQDVQGDDPPDQKYYGQSWEDNNEEKDDFDEKESRENPESDVWKPVVDEKTGHTYYFNVRTKDTTWNPPPEMEAKHQEEPVWTKLFDEKRNSFYFLNSENNEISYEVPPGFSQYYNPLDEQQQEVKETSINKNSETFPEVTDNSQNDVTDLSDTEDALEKNVQTTEFSTSSVNPEKNETKYNEDNENKKAFKEKVNEEIEEKDSKTYKSLEKVFISPVAESSGKKPEDTPKPLQTGEKEIRNDEILSKADKDTFSENMNGTGNQRKTKIVNEKKNEEKVRGKKQNKAINNKTGAKKSSNAPTDTINGRRKRPRRSTRVAAQN